MLLEEEKQKRFRLLLGVGEAEWGGDVVRGGKAKKDSTVVVGE